MPIVKFLSMILGLLFLLFIVSGLFIVQEHERAIVLRLGQIEKNSNGQPNIRTPGLNFKIPFVGCTCPKRK